MNFDLYRNVLRPLLFLRDAEKVHHFAMAVMARFGPVLRPLWPAPDRRHERTVFGVTFPNPVGLAAGFDKNAIALAAWELLGFGFVEVGTVTARAQPGNPKPRVFRVKSHRAVINRLGFNNDGADTIALRLRKLHASKRWPRIPVGINLGKSRVASLEEATADYLLSFERLHSLADYVVLNVSSPNTPGLRALQDRAALHDLLQTIQRRNQSRTPLLVKIAPDLSWDAIEDVLSLAEEHELSGIIATNTTIDHSSIPPEARQQGGLSGAPLRQRSTEIVRFIAKKSKLPIIAVGGIDSPDAAREKFDAGASLVQLYTGFIYEGPALVRRIVQSLGKRRK